ncbi:ABC transporter substrate-binding protein [Phyllobacterium sp. SB3]|uniref:ABC transporter substrate-binding protein n=1 Tax=Phyllobacterium sp. SB3 TaxID=3156073 RepID=UPI0032AF93FB
MSLNSAFARTPSPKRIISLDAPSTEMLVKLGVEPIGVAGLTGYLAAEGDVPELSKAMDVGFYYEPNLELLHSLAPQLIISSFGVGTDNAILERIAPVLSVPIYGAGRPVYDSAADALLRIGESIGENRQADAFLRLHNKTLSSLRSELGPRRMRPFYLATPLLDGRHMIVYGTNSLFDGVMRRLGLSNAYHGPTSPWGIANIGIESLIANPDAGFVYIESPITNAALHALKSTALWQRIPFVRAGRLAPIPYVEMYGALPTAQRFAQAISAVVSTGLLDES